MLNKCKVITCSNKKPRRFYLCGACFSKIPKQIRMDLRRGTEKGTHSLRATPTREWIAKAIEYVGMIKVPVIMGHGINAVKVADSKRELVSAK